MLIGFVVWVGTLGLSRYVSLASMLGAVSLPISAVMLRERPLLAGAALLISLFVVIRHRANISRILAGTESKVGRKPAAPGSSASSKP
jgi:glycerol-3-phosphate acyltransferase PlsY